MKMIQDGTSSDDSSGGDTDDDCISDRSTTFPRRRARLERRERGRDRRTYRVAAKGGDRLEAVQRRWDAEMKLSPQQCKGDDRQNRTGLTDTTASGADGADDDTSRSGSAADAAEGEAGRAFAERLQERSARFDDGANLDMLQESDREPRRSCNL